MNFSYIRKLEPIIIMKKFCLFLLTVPFLISCSEKTEPKIVIQRDTVYVSDLQSMKSIQEFGVLPENSPLLNKKNLQKAIDWASASGTALYVTPVENGYKIDGGLVLKKNVSLIGAHGPTGRGTVNSKGTGPTGSLFVITDKSDPFITVQSATQISGIQFYYPNQSWTDSTKVIAYKPTILKDPTQSVLGVTLRDLTFYGEYMAMDFRAERNSSCEQILFEDCYGYPFGGCFIAIDHCYDIPRILHCHVNPANCRAFGRHLDSSVLQSVIDKKSYTYWIDHTDNLIVMDIFTYGNYGGIYLGPVTYGQFTSFNFDSVSIGIYRDGAESVTKNWQISQGLIIANLGDDYTKIHPIVVTGSGRTNISNVDAFSCAIPGVKSIGYPKDFICITGHAYPIVSLVSCTAEVYGDDFYTLENPKAYMKMVSCVDKGGNFIDYDYQGVDPGYESDVTTYWDNCDNLDSWQCYPSGYLELDTSDKKEGDACVSVTGKDPGKYTLAICKKYLTPINARVTQRYGHLLLDIYVSDVTLAEPTGESSLEITSSGTYDMEETFWQLGINKGFLHNGWNQLDLKMAESWGGAVYDSINFFRYYQCEASGDLTLKFDNLRFYQE